MCFCELSHTVDDTNIDVEANIELLTVGVKQVDFVDIAPADGE